MKSKKRVVSGMMFLALSVLISCGGPDVGSRSASARLVRRPPVFFLIGGRDSCEASHEDNTENPRGSGLYEALMTLMGRFTPDVYEFLEFFVACHYNGSDDMAYVSSWEPEVQFGLSETAVRGEILKKRSEISQQQAIMIGHSHGGWVAMSLASTLPAEQGFGHLYTLDPISKIECTMTTPLGCQSAPEDLRAAARREIAANTSVWHNYYETETFYLHSSSISEADANYKLAAEHTDMDQDIQVWNDIYNGAAAVL